jgi:hypothetical protein
MRTVDIVRLLALAMIWSASFVFIHVLAPVLGPSEADSFSTRRLRCPCSLERRWSLAG